MYILLLLTVASFTYVACSSTRVLHLEALMWMYICKELDANVLDLSLSLSPQLKAVYCLAAACDKAGWLAWS